MFPPTIRGSWAQGHLGHREEELEPEIEDSSLLAAHFSVWWIPEFLRNQIK